MTLYPGIRIDKLIDPALTNAVAADLPECEEIVFTSAEAVPLFIEAMLESGKDNRALSGIRLTAIGKQTKEKLREYGLAADLLVSRRSADLIRQACAGNWRPGTKVLLAGTEKHTAQLAAELAALPSSLLCRCIGKYWRRSGRLTCASLMPSAFPVPRR